MLDTLYQYRSQVIFFAMFMAAAIPVLFYYQRRNPHARFRPKFGEMCLVSLIAVFLCGGLAAGLGGIFQEHNDGRELSAKPDPEPLSYDGGNQKKGKGIQTQRGQTDEEKVKQHFGVK